MYQIYFNDYPTGLIFEELGQLVDSKQWLSWVGHPAINIYFKEKRTAKEPPDTWQLYEGCDEDQ